MAYQGPNKRPELPPTSGKIVRTPAPTMDLKNGGEDYGQAQDVNTPSSIPPGTVVESKLASNLRQSQADSEDVLSQVIAHGVSGRDDKIPADGNLQTRSVAAKPYPTTYGMTKRPAAKIPGAK
jgi:hypothetical protein